MRFRAPFLLLVLAIVTLAAGCDRPPREGLTAEIDDPNYTRGKSLLRQNRNQEALAAFLKVIERREGDAPESHLDVGQIYHEQIKDQLAAIYHYRKYIELRPNGQKVDLVRGRIDAATRDFVRTLPAQPYENLGLRNDLHDLVDRLQRENVQLKEELAASRASTSVSMSRGTVVSLPIESPGLVTRAPPPAPPPAEQPFVSAQMASPPAAQPVPPTRPTAAPPGGRRHVVAQGENLWAISSRYTADGQSVNAKLNEIIAANPGHFPHGRDSKLPIGVELRIP